MSSDIALAVDEAQYAADAGPCLDALGGPVVGIADMTMVLTWPHFRRAALGLGLGSSLSIPLFAARGAPIAALNLYSHTAHVLTPLSDAVAAVFHQLIPDPVPQPRWLDPGSCQLVTGTAEALAVQRDIQIAIGILMETDRISSDEAYLQLRQRAAEDGRALLDVARQVAQRP